MSKLFRRILVKSSMAETNKMNQSYSAGKCNIGHREVSVRKKFLSLFLPLSLIFTIVNFFQPDSIVLWISLLLSTFCALVLINEIRTGFCIIFGFFHLYNFKSLGQLDEVKKVEHRKIDNRRVLRMFVGSLTFSLVYSSTVHFLAMLR